MTTKHTIDIIDSVPLIHTHPTPLMGYGRIVKRIMDVVGGTIGIIIASPIMLLVAIAVNQRPSRTDFNARQTTETPHSLQSTV